MKAACSLSRNDTASATSPGWARRPSGMRALTWASSNVACRDVALRHLSGDIGRTDRVDAYALLRPLNGQNLGEHRHAGLGRAIGGAARESRLGIGAGDEHDRAAGVPHALGARLRNVERAVELHVHHARPVRGRQRDGVVRLADARAVHHAIEPAEPIDRSLRGGLARFGAGDVARHADRLAASGDDVRGLRPGLIRVQVRDDDSSALRCKARGGFGANAARSARDEYDLLCFVRLVAHR